MDAQCQQRTSTTPPTSTTSDVYNTDDIPRLIESLRSEKVKSNITDILSLVRTLLSIITVQDDDILQICIDVGAPSVLTSLLQLQIVRENGDAAGEIAEALMIIAHNEENLKQLSL